jgi:hypothetical protein
MASSFAYMSLTASLENYDSVFTCVVFMSKFVVIIWLIIGQLVSQLNVISSRREDWG